MIPRTACWLLASFMTAGLHAQAPTIIVPGSPAVDGRKIPLANSRYKSTMGGRSTDVTRDTIVDGKPALFRILTVARPNATTVDTTVLLRSTLAPIWKHAYAGTQRTFLEFHGTRVTGIRYHDGTVDSIDIETPVPVFEAFSADLPLAALDLRENLHVRLPVYHSTLGFTWIDATIGAPQPMPGFERTWPISIIEGSMKMTWFVDVKTREQAGAVNALPTGGEVRITREP